VSSRDNSNSDTVAYFSMEIALEPAMPTYSGGLGVLAGDTLRAAADLGIAMVGVTLLYRKGYFSQHLDAEGNQSESPALWSQEQYLEPMEARVSVTIERRPVVISAWRFIVHGISGHRVPVYFLDTAVPENTPFDQGLTDHLYGGDEWYRLCQEIVLGFGGVAMLRALGYDNVHVYHMNEGHSALLTLALIEEQIGNGGHSTVTQADRDAVRQQCVFTTHTPIPAAHDLFSVDQITQALGQERSSALGVADCCLNGTLNMTHLALLFSRYINGVSMRHEQISRDMFPHYPINSITNGVHAPTWTAPSFQRLYDRYIPEWRQDNRYLRYAIGIPLEAIQQAHAEAKRELLGEVEGRTGIRLNPSILTLGFARRATAYKRADLLFSDIDRLRSIADQVGLLQVVYAGKAHPKDEGGKSLIRPVFKSAAALGGSVRVVYLEEYDLALAKYFCSGVDIWLNTPQKPHEASGTSGMKAALNGVPSLSVLDGWWIEGCVEGVTGWAIGDSWEAESNPSKETASLYEKLRYLIVPMFYGRPIQFAQIMRSAIALNASFYTAQRMMYQYLHNAYFAT
jgi:starch phosphorylase